MAFLKGVQNIFDKLKPQLVKKTIVEQIRKIKEPSVRRRFEEVKRDMIVALKAHPIIDALEYGPGYGNNDVANILGGYGDLFSFIGFPRRKKPVNPIIALIRGIKLIPSGSEGLTLKWSVTGFPSIKDIEAVTPMPWAEGLSWATALERGIPNLGFYLNKKSSRSRSNYGLQVKGIVRDGPKSSRPIRWITPFLKEWRAAFETLNNTKVL